MTDRKPDGTCGRKLADVWPDFAHEAYIWCRHCARVFSIAEWDRTECCPNAKCNGSLLGARAWSDVARRHGWPTVPIEEQVYDPYSDR